MSLNYKLCRYYFFLISFFILLIFNLSCSENKTDTDNTQNFLTLTPNCPQTGETYIRISGDINGIAVDIYQFENNASGGFSQLDGGSFSITADPSLFIISFFWDNLVYDGNIDTITEGTFRMPQDHELAGTWCINIGHVGVPLDGDTNGSIKFYITSVIEGDTCEGTPVSANLIGCWQSSNK